MNTTSLSPIKTLKAHAFDVLERARGKYSMYSLDELVQEVRADKEDVMELVNSNRLMHRYTNSGLYFPPNAPELFIKEFFRQDIGIEPEFEAKLEPQEQKSELVKESIRNTTINQSTSVPLEVTIAAGHAKEVHPDKHTVEHIIDRGVLFKEELNDVALLNSLLLAGKRRVRVDAHLTGLQLEISQTLKNLIVKGKVNRITYRCVLAKWSMDDVIPESEIEKIASQYTRVIKKLKRKPSTTEFKLHSRKVETIEDAINAHLEFNVRNKHGEGSSEWNKIEALCRNHLSKPVEVTLPNRQKRTIVLMTENLKQLTKADFECYLNNFKDRNGTYDTIVSRVKAAVNFCIAERLIDKNDFFEFYNVSRIGKERHVEVSDEDLKRMFKYLRDIPNSDFNFFMHLEMTGHFRTSQTLSLRYDDFEFDHNRVWVKPKNGKLVCIPLAKSMIDLVEERKAHHLARYGKANFLFPSEASASGHLETFVSQWNKMRQDLGFFSTDTEGKVIYKYRLHDFRETMLGRMSDADDPTLATLLGHLSLHALKHYRKANSTKAQRNAQSSHERLKAIVHKS